jgi:hypothetical protein
MPVIAKYVQSKETNCGCKRQVWVIYEERRERGLRLLHCDSSTNDSVLLIVNHEWKLV